MEKEIKIVEEQPLEEILAEEEVSQGEIVEENKESIINVNMMPQPLEPKPELISDQQLKGVYDEILGMLRNEHKQCTEYIDNFAECVINGGDSTTSSKEALVNLVKIRTDIPDKMSKIADLMTRLKMKQPDTYKPYLNQTNNVMISDTTAERRALLDSIKKAKRKK